VVRLAPLIEPKSFHRESLEVNKPENSPQRAADQAPHLQPSGVTGLSPPLLLLSDSYILIETVAGDASLFFCRVPVSAQVSEPIASRFDACD
jgi:hypothetical protein